MTAVGLEGRWRRVVSDLGWRDLAIALAVAALFLLFGPHGGALFVTLHEGVDPLTDPDKHYLREFVEAALTLGLPLVVVVRLADDAIAEGVSRWLAYGSALLAVGALNHLYRLMPFYHSPRSTPPPAETAWYYLAIILEGTVGLTIYARWRSTQASLRLVQASETERARAAQRLQSARLLALQARVDPQLLFDSLKRIGTLQRHDPPAADALLTDLIALLRAMLPAETATTSSVEREFTVVDAWLRVSQAVLNEWPPVALRVAPESRQARLAPMLALPLVRTLLEATHGRCDRWRLEADVAGGRLLVSIGGADASEDGMRKAMRAIVSEERLRPLRERLAALHGEAAHLFVSIPTATVTLDLPFLLENSDEASNER